MSDSKISIDEKYEYINKINYLEGELKTRITIFDDSYRFYELGSFLTKVDFIEKFRVKLFSEWKNDICFNKLYERLKVVYHKAYSAEQEEEIKLYGSIKSLDDKFRAIPENSVKEGEQNADSI